LCTFEVLATRKLLCNGNFRKKTCFARRKNRKYQLELIKVHISMTSESTTTVCGYLSLLSYCRNMTLRCAFCAHIFSHLLDLKPISKAGRGGGKRACQMDGLMETRQSQASQISSGGRPGQALRCPLCRTGDSGVRIAIHGISAAMCAS
jgi:hypothetical protein